MSRYGNHGQIDKSEAKTNSKILAGIEPGTELSPVIESLPYISKSRITTYLKCPYKFYLQYWCDHRTPGSIHTEKGSRLHKTFEEFHLNLMEYVEREGWRPDRFYDLLPHYSNYAQWIEQYGAFIQFEERRWNEVLRHCNSWNIYRNPLDLWTPIEVEAEFWMGEPPEWWVEERGEPDYVTDAPPVGDTPWMGYADLIVDSRSVPGVEGDGATIIDYKTGSCPTIRYANSQYLDEILNEGIFLEGEYYGWMAEEHFDVDAVAGYYPGDDELIVSPYPSERRREVILDSVEAMTQLPEEVPPSTPPENFEHSPGPLCNYSSGNCHFYNICPSTK